MFSPSYVCEYRPALHWDKTGARQDPVLTAKTASHGVGAAFLLPVGRAPCSAQPRSYGGNSGGNRGSDCLSAGQSQVSLNNYPRFCSQKENQNQKGKKNPDITARMENKRAFACAKEQVVLHHLPAWRDWGEQRQTPASPQGDTPAPCSSPAAPRLDGGSCPAFPSPVPSVPSST